MKFSNIIIKVKTELENIGYYGNIKTELQEIQNNINYLQLQFCSDIDIIDIKEKQDIVIKYLSYITINIAKCFIICGIEPQQTDDYPACLYSKIKENNKIQEIGYIPFLIQNIENRSFDCMDLNKIYTGFNERFFPNSLTDFNINISNKQMCDYVFENIRLEDKYSNKSNYYFALLKLYQQHIKKGDIEIQSNTISILSSLIQSDNGLYTPIQYIIDYISENSYIIKLIKKKKDIYPFNDPIIFLLYYMISHKIYTFLQYYPFIIDNNIREICADVGRSLDKLNKFS